MTKGFSKPSTHTHTGSHSHSWSSTPVDAMGHDTRLCLSKQAHPRHDNLAAHTNCPEFGKWDMTPNQNLCKISDVPGSSRSPDCCLSATKRTSRARKPPWLMSVDLSPKNSSYPKSHTCPTHKKPCNLPEHHRAGNKVRLNLGCCPGKSIAGGHSPNNSHMGTHNAHMRKETNWVALRKKREPFGDPSIPKK